MVSTYDSRTKTEKVWGEEDTIINTPLYCGKVLFVDEGMQTSLHMHPTKHETMLAVFGNGVIEYYPKGTQAPAEYVAMREAEATALVIEPGTWHRIAASMGEPFSIIEFSTQHSDDDVQRLEESGPINGVRHSSK
jgi:mannose-6-phosphate isomerase-like protein (cupin superfamily)